MSTAFDLMVAPNGARLTQSDHPALPLTTREIAHTAMACAKEGATAVHAHIRDARGQHSLDAALYHHLMRDIAAISSIHVQFSTEAAGIFDVATQRACLEAAPSQDASIALREIARDPANLRAIYHAAADKGIDMQHIVYDTHDLVALLDHFETGSIPMQSRRVLCVLGRYSHDLTSTPQDLDPFLKAMSGHDLNWMVCAFGRHEQDCLMAALDAGGHARIGFENNRLTPDGSILPDNAASVASFVERAAKSGFSPKQVTS